MANITAGVSAVIFIYLVRNIFNFDEFLTGFHFSVVVFSIRQVETSVPININF